MSLKLILSFSAHSLKFSNPLTFDSCLRKYVLRTYPYFLQFDLQIVIYSFLFAFLFADCGKELVGLFLFLSVQEISSSHHAGSGPRSRRPSSRRRTIYEQCSLDKPRGCGYIRHVRSATGGQQYWRIQTEIIRRNRYDHRRWKAMASW